MQIRVSSISPRDGVELCSATVDQSETGIQIKNRRPVSLALNLCLRPELLENSHNSLFSSFSFVKSHCQSIDSSDPILPPATTHNLLLTTFILHSFIP